MFNQILIPESLVTFPGVLSFIVICCKPLLNPRHMDRELLISSHFLYNKYLIIITNYEAAKIFVPVQHLHRT